MTKESLKFYLRLFATAFVIILVTVAVGVGIAMWFGWTVWWQMALCILCSLAVVAVILGAIFFVMCFLLALPIWAIINGMIYNERMKDAAKKTVDYETKNIS